MAALLLVLLACNPDPGSPDQQVGYRDGLDGGANSGERGTVILSEVLWSGSVGADGKRDHADVFVELRNQGNRPVNLSDWRLELEGVTEITWRIPSSDRQLQVGEHGFVVAKSSGCFPDADWVIPELELPDGDPFRLTLLDADERLIESAGSRETPPFAGGWDYVRSRSMERVELMFGGSGTEPASWHHYTSAPVEVANDDRVAEACRGFTLASPGRPNSPDYSGAYSTGSFE